MSSHDDPRPPVAAMSALFGAEPHDFFECPKCGRLFERSFTIEQDGKRVEIAGHPVGHPDLCKPIVGAGTKVELDKRKRRARG